MDRTSIFKSFLEIDPSVCISKLNLKPGNLSVVCQNIRSINKNIDDFKVLLARLKFTPDIIILTECRLTEGIPPCFPLLGYNLFYSKKYINQNDGIVAYCQNNLKVTVEEPIFEESNCLVLKVGKDVVITSIYRSPSFHNTDKFINSLDITLNKYKSFKTNILIGDVNIDIKPNNLNAHSDRYLDLTGLHGFHPAHTFPTHGANCIDHILLKTNNVSTTVVCQTSVTDHSAVMVAIDMQIARIPILPRTITKINYEALEDQLGEINWDLFYEIDDVNIACEQFITLLTTLYNKNKITYMKAHKLYNKKPWITPSLIKCIQKRDLLHVKHNKNPKDINLRTTYYKYRNTCNFILQNLKNQYNQSLLEQNMDNPKKTWKAIKSICHLDSGKTSCLDLLDTSDTPKSALNKVNKYFTTVGSSLAKDILATTESTEEQLLSNIKVGSRVTSFSLYLTPTDRFEVTKFIMNLKTDGSPGWDELPPIAFKNLKHLIAEPLSHIINLSIISGVVPELLKLAQVCPIYKDGDTADPSNYRPISLLTIVAKLLEKVIKHRLSKFLEENNLLANNQFGFRHKRSTEDAVIKLTDTVASSLDKGERCIGVFLDLKKAFDTVSIPLLLKKLEVIGVRGTALSWFSSYLFNRRQYVKQETTKSDTMPTYYGVPQGSVLGPMLFLVYINDLCLLEAASAQIFTFADDTAILFTGRSWEDVKSKTEVGLLTVSQWLQNNLLTLNTSKTKYLCFHINNSTNPDNFTLKIHNCKLGSQANNSCQCNTIERTRSIRYLGVIIDDKLNWSDQIQTLVSRVRKLLHLFKRIRSVANQAIIKSIYYALCQSIICYCIDTWGGTHKTTLIKLERAQRAALKVLFSKPYRFPTTKLYQEIKVLTVRQLFVLKTILRFHKTSLETRIITGRTSRYAHWCIPIHSTQFGNRFYFAKSPTLYTKANKILDLINLTTSKCKRILFIWLVNKPYEDTEILIQ